MINPVLQKWALRLSCKMQTALISAIRGPDDYHPELKKLTRWIRFVVLKNADETTNFMKKELRHTYPDYFKVKHEFEFCRVHFAFHVLHAMKIIGAFHPDNEISGVAMKFFRESLHDLHLNSETRREQSIRMRDK